MPAHRPLLVAQGDVVAYGAIQSVLWASQTVLSPVIGMASDYFGRRPVIIATLLCSALSNALLALADDLKTMGLARLIGGLGFQMFLFRAYFADTAPKKQRAAKFGIIGVLQAALLFRSAPLRSAPLRSAPLCHPPRRRPVPSRAAGRGALRRPGGRRLHRGGRLDIAYQHSIAEQSHPYAMLCYAKVGSKRDAVWLSCIFCLMAAALCLMVRRRESSPPHPPTPTPLPHTPPSATLPRTPPRRARRPRD